MFNRLLKITNKTRYLLSSLKFKNFYRQNKEVWSIINKVHNEHLTYLEIDALCDLAQVAILNEKKQLNGIIIEAGCALGGSAIVLGSAKSKARKAFIYDIFGMIPLLQKGMIRMFTNATW